MALQRFECSAWFKAADLVYKVKCILKVKLVRTTKRKQLLLLKVVDGTNG